MSGSGANASGNLSPNARNTTSGTVTGTIPAAPLLPYMAGLSLLDFNLLINDPIFHDVGWTIMPTKLPSDIPKFEGLAREDPTNHVQSFHMWCSSNSITDDSVRLRLFQRTLTDEASKCLLIRPHPLIPPLQLLLGIFCLISCFPFIMTLVPNF